MKHLEIIFFEFFFVKLINISSQPTKQLILKGILHSHVVQCIPLKQFIIVWLACAKMKTF